MAKGRTDLLRRPLKIQTAFIISLLLLAAVSAPARTRQSAAKVSSLEEIKAEFAAVPCQDKERLSAAKALFEKLGGPSPDVTVEKYKGVENLVARVRGTSPEIIVVGAHYDKVSEGCGAIDNWTGVVALAHLYATLKAAPTPRKNMIFVAFGKEEKGSVGARAMVESIPKEQLNQYCAMVNLDSLGLSAPQVLDNVSSSKLRDLVADLAKEMKVPFSHARIDTVEADSSVFLKKKIPAVSIHGLNSDWSSIIHSPRDEGSKVNPVSVYLVYKLTLAVVGSLDESPCGAFR